MVSSAKDTARKSHYSSPMEACLDAHLRNENRNDPRSILVVANNIVAKLEDDARTEQALDRGLRPSVICIKNPVLQDHSLLCLLGTRRM